MNDEVYNWAKQQNFETGFANLYRIHSVHVMYCTSVTFLGVIDELFCFV